MASRHRTIFTANNTRSVFFIILVVLAVLSIVHMDLRPMRLVRGVPNLWTLFGDAVPPDITLANAALVALFETVEIAFLGTIFGALIALPLALLASRNLFRKRFTTPARIILAAVRTMPSLLLALVFVIMVGPGPFAGVLATALYSIGYLGKLHYEAIEGIHPSPLEALSGIGTSRLQLIRFVVLPEAANTLLSQLLFMFEYNIRASSILGFVGAGGIGFYIMGYMRLLQYDKVLTLLLVLFVVVLVIDYISTKVRDKYLLWK